MDKTILLNSGKSLRSKNVDNHLKTELFTERKLLPTDSLTETVDTYEEYVKEKDASEVYRLLFTINPICSNVLFNAFTEVVYKEGSEEAEVCKSAAVGDWSQDTNIDKYLKKYKGLDAPSYVGFSGEDLLRDTAFSHPNIGGLAYHCGVDIFNNHTLRRRQFAVVNDIKDKNSATGKNFNTIGDFLRDSGGNVIEEKVIKFNNDDKLNTGATKMHLYTVDSIDSFQKAINDKLVERDGWYGFINPASLDVPNVTIDGQTYTVNKCMNDKNAGDFVDMYPDRTLYSFLPKYNPYRKRLEKNWDYCLTYPAENIENELTTIGRINGIKCEVMSSLKNTVFDTVDNALEDTVIYLRTQVTNTFQRNTQINVSIIDTGNNNKIAESFYPITVEDVGYLGEDGAHLFGVRVGELYTVFSGLRDPENKVVLDSEGFLSRDYEIRVRKFVNGIDCKYYFRKFKKLSEDDYNNSINKVAFSQNIFSDKIAQILYNDDIVTTGIVDNQGRPLSELYLTIVKRNKGFEEWIDGDTGDAIVEYSHCFGMVSSGMDLTPEEDAYNVHKLRNIENKPAGGVTPLESGITIEQDSFLGDLVEFSPYTVNEEVLETVYHRFNTVQREADAYKEISYDEIKYDDYDIGNTFELSGGTIIHEEKSCHEGYYYKAHYRVPLRQYGTEVKQGSHKKMVFTESPMKAEGTKYFGVTSVNYYLQPGDTLYLYNKEKSERIEGEVLSVNGRNYTEVTFRLTFAVDDIKKYTIFKKNSTMPDYAYDLMDASGRYLWREELSDKELLIGDELYDSIFTNGANYRHLNINFYLRRQDPTGEYGLNTKDTVDADTSMVAEGKIKDITTVEYINEGEGTVC